MGLIVTQPYGDNARYDFAVDNGKRLKRVQVGASLGPAKGRASYSVNVGRAYGERGGAVFAIRKFMR